MRKVSSLLFLLLVVFAVGCGDKQTAAPVVQQDELQKWVSENPSPPETPVD